MITDAELATMRATLELTFNSTCDVKRRAPAKTGTGANLTPYGAHLAGVACRRSPMPGNRWRVLSEQQQAQAPATFHLTHSADVRVKDRIEHGGRAYEVIGVTKKAPALELQADAVELNQP